MAKREGPPYPKNKKDSLEDEPVEETVIEDPAFEALARNINETNELVTKREDILKRHANAEGTEARKIEKAREKSKVGSKAREEAEAKRTEEQKQKIKENLGIAKRGLKESLVLRRDAEEKLIAPRRARIDELRKELATWKRREAPTGVVRDKVPERVLQRDPKDILNEIAKLDEEIRGFEAKYGKDYRGTSVPDKLTRSVRSGAFATDPIQSPETPKEQRESLAAALSSDQFTAYDQTMKKALGEDVPDTTDTEPTTVLEYDEARAFLGLEGDGGSETRIEGGDAPESPAQPERLPRDPYMAEDMQVMVNSVLTKQALGNNKKAIDRFVKKHSPNVFPADPTYATTPEARVIRTRIEERQKREERKKWFGRGGVLAAAGLLAFLGLNNGKKAETVEANAAKRPAAERSAADAGLTLPSLDQATVYAPPNTLTEGIPQSLSEWAGGSAKTEAGKPKVNKPVTAAKKPATAASQPKVARSEAAAPESFQAEAKATYAFPWDSRFNPWEVKESGRLRSESPAEHLERMAREEGYSTPYPIIGNSNENLSESSSRPAHAAPEVSAAETVPEAPEAPVVVPENERVVGPQVFRLQENGKEVYAVAGGRGIESFESAERFAETLPAGTWVRFEATGSDGRPMRGLFVSTGEGKKPAMRTRNPETNRPFTALETRQLQNPLPLNLNTGAAGR